ncbi:MAG: LuxR C-terminal-related transcriptional regulator [Candidatus Tectimicrobiota bacterium]
MGQDTTPPVVRVVLIDDYTLAHAHLLRTLYPHREMQVIAETREAAEAAELIQQHQPDLLLIDSVLPPTQHCKELLHLREAFPQLGIVVIVPQVLDSPAYHDAGVPGITYVLRQVVLHNRQALAQTIYTAVKAPPADAGVGPVPLFSQSLTPRQRDVLHLIVQGLSTREIAQQLQRSVKTVEAHRRQLMQRLGARNVAELVRNAIQQNLHLGFE